MLGDPGLVTLMLSARKTYLNVRKLEKELIRLYLCKELGISTASNTWEKFQINKYYLPHVWFFQLQE